MKTLVDLLRYAIVLACAVTLPNSIGRLRLSSRDPHAAPHVRYNFFVDPNDLDRLVEVVGLSRKIGRTAPFSDLIDHEMAPGNAVDDGEALRTNIVDTSEPTCIRHRPCRWGRKVGEIPQPIFTGPNQITNFP
jgi:choline dehydrogenase-like flavoprotein